MNRSYIVEKILAKLAKKGKSYKGKKSGQVDLHPTLKHDPDVVQESTGKTAVVTFGRMNPPTVGHQKLVDKVHEVAKKHGGKPMVFLSHSQDAKKNPLSHEHKVKYARKAFGSSVQDGPHRHMLDVLKHVSKEHEHVHVVVGGDRKEEFHKLVHKYNGHPDHYSFKSIHVHSAGDRDPDSDGVDGMSASKMRAAASAKDHEKFKSGLPDKLKKHAHEIMHHVRRGMGEKD